MTYLRELRDPVHGFVRLTADEMKLVDSWPVQRLRHIHQLAMSYLVYPGTTHRRFEHSLGVMELAGRVYDIVTDPAEIDDETRAGLPPELADRGFRDYWRKVIRLAGLMHDVGHPPFSHAAEKALLPSGWNHERVGIELIRSEEVAPILDAMTPPVRAIDVAKIATGPEKCTEPFSTWEALLSDIISDDAFGVDRMDYLLRDSYHAGVVYGRFDHFRLIDTLRLMQKSGSLEPAIGVVEGGLKSAEALSLARYFMYSQVYFHPVRMAYDIHLIDFLEQWLEGGQLPTEVGAHLRLTDNEVTSAFVSAARDSTDPLNQLARRLVAREHFRVLYRRNPSDLKVNPEASRLIFEQAEGQFGKDVVRRGRILDRGGSVDFPVRVPDGRVLSSILMSEALEKLPPIAADFVFGAPEIRSEANAWLLSNRDTIVKEGAIDGQA